MKLSRLVGAVSLVSLVLVGCAAEPAPPTTSEGSHNQSDTPADADPEPSKGPTDAEIEGQAHRVLKVLLDSDADSSLANVELAEIVNSIELYCAGNPQDFEDMPVRQNTTATSVYGSLILTVGKELCPDGGEQPEDPFDPVPRTGLYYQAMGPGVVSITMRTGTGSQQHQVFGDLKNTNGDPWLNVDSVSQPYISVQNTSGNAGETRCRITRDGRIVADNWSSGRGSIATCSP